MKSQNLIFFGAMALIAACAQQEEPAMVAPEPIYDKFGNVVVGVDAEPATVMVDTNGDGVADTPVTPEPTPDPTPPNTNQNQIQNQNQSQGG